jgi:hypothetical protein
MFTHKSPSNNAKPSYSTKRGSCIQLWGIEVGDVGEWGSKVWGIGISDVGEWGSKVWGIGISDVGEWGSKVWGMEVSPQSKMPANAAFLLFINIALVV